jgi:tripartite-type tricarboxylate transporter receptor subunit TctC
MSSLLGKSIAGAALAFLCGSFLLAETEKARAEVSFKGKTIEVLLGSAAGGGTDGTTRLVGTFLEKYLPGNPSMRYRNLPGGHGAKALNYFAKVKPDGLIWAGGGSSHVDPNSLRKGVTEYNPTKFGFFGGVQRGGSVVFMRTDHQTNLTDKSKPPVVIGVVDGDRSWEQMITWGAELLGWNVRFVVGYPGSAMMLLAIRRGETHMMGTSNLFILKDMFATGEFVGVAQLGGGASVGEDIAQRSEFGKIPTFTTLVQGKLQGLPGETFDFWSALNDMDKWYALPPGTPKEIVDTYRTAWDKMVKDPEFIRQGKILFSADFATVSGAVITEHVRKTAYPKSEVVAFMDQLKAKNGLPAEPLSEEELAALAKAKGLDKAEIPSVKAVLLAVGEGGRDVEFAVAGANRKIDVSNTRTSVNIAGKRAGRADLKAGITCTIEFIDGAKEAHGINCQ